MNHLEALHRVFRTCIKLAPIVLSLLIMLACSSDEPSSHARSGDHDWDCGKLCAVHAGIGGDFRSHG